MTFLGGGDLWQNGPGASRDIHTQQSTIGARAWGDCFGTIYFAMEDIWDAFYGIRITKRVPIDEHDCTKMSSSESG